MTEASAPLPALADELARGAREQRRIWLSSCSRSRRSTPRAAAALTAAAEPLAHELGSTPGGLLEDEHLVVDSLVQRAALIALLLAAPPG